MYQFVGVKSVLGRGFKDVRNDKGRVRPPNSLKPLQSALSFVSQSLCRYLSFHASLSEEAKKLPVIIGEELDSYDASLCKYLGVDRSPPKVHPLVAMSYLTLSSYRPSTLFVVQCTQVGCSKRSHLESNLWGVVNSNHMHV